MINDVWVTNELNLSVVRLWLSHIARKILFPFAWKILILNFKMLKFILIYDFKHLHMKKFDMQEFRYRFFHMQDLQVHLHMKKSISEFYFGFRNSF